MALWGQPQPGLQLEPARQPSAHVQKYHCSQHERAEQAPNPALGPAALGPAALDCRDGMVRTRQRTGTAALREHCQTVRQQEEAGQRTSQRASE